MKPYHLLLGLSLALCSSLTYGQAINSSPAPDGYELSLETVTEDIGVLVGALGVTDLTGYSCTHLYVLMNNADDFMSSVSGDVTNPTYINTTTNYYHAALGAATPNGINSLLFAVYPDLAYDSWVTIGLEGVPNALAGEANVSTVQSTDNPWVTNFDPGGGAAGDNIAIDDLIGGAWYALNGDANGVAGDDLKVLIGQFTTTGELSGQVYCQVFINGDGMTEFRDTFYFGAGAPAPGCTDESACNYDADATDDDGSCTYPADQCDGALNVDCDCNCLNDADADGICDEDEIGGCQDEAACNYSADATDDDGSCTYAEPFLDCDGNCLNDADGDLICDEEEVPGCQDVDACNFNVAATDDDGSCTYPAADNLDCDGNCLNDADGDGICDEEEVPGCQDEAACNYSADATDDDGSCTYPAADNLDCDGNCLNDADADGICDEDEIGGCQDDTACNYSAEATDDDGSCIYAVDGLDCDGNCLADADGDGICDGDDPCNEPDLTPAVLPMVPASFIAEVTLDGQPALGMTLIALVDGETAGVTETFEYEGGSWVSMTIYAGAGDDITFQLFDAAECALYDIDLTFTVTEDGDELSTFDDPADLPFLSGNAIPGCTDQTACNYDALADLDDGSCIYPFDLYGNDLFDCDGNCLNDDDGDGICNEDETVGCTDPEACNAGDFSDTDNSLCIFPFDLYGVDYLDCEGNCLSDVDADGVCDQDEVDGCTDAAACNFNADATEEDGSCEYESCAGCTDDAACNYDADATIDDGSCAELDECGICGGEGIADGACDCDGNVLDALGVCGGDCAADADGDGICDDEDDCVGTLDACGVCNGEGPVDGYDCDGNCLEDTDGDGICDFEDPCNEPDTTVEVLPLIPSTVIAEVFFDGAPIVGGTVLAQVDGNTVGLAVAFEYEGGSWINMNVYAAPGEEIAFILWDAEACEQYMLEFTLTPDVEGDDLGTFEDPQEFPFGSGDPIPGCLDETACNYNPMATTDGVPCVYADQFCDSDFVDCDCECLNDGDGDGVCDEEEVPGCGDPVACNYAPDATDFDGTLCTYPEFDYVDCDGNCLNDADEDGICDELETEGCTDEFACNYDADASEDDGSCTYADPGFDCNGDPIELDPCDPLCYIIDESLEDYIVQCLDDLAAVECVEDASVYNACTGVETFASSCVTLPAIDSITTGEATTALGVGPDGAIRVYGLQMQGLAASDYFVDSGDGLEFTQYSNGTAVLQGNIENSADSNQGFRAYLVFENGMSGVEWGALGKGFKYAYTCVDVDTDPWQIYTLKNDQSYLQGTGSFEGSMLSLSHAPVNHHFGFQVGEAANDHNCNFGLGGWFAWEGQVNGVPVSGALGDVIVDLEMVTETFEYDELCATNVYTFIDSCGAYNIEQEVCRFDTIAPTFIGCPGEATVACTEDIPAVATVTVEDNCDDLDSIPVSVLGDVIIDQVDGGCYTIERTWMAEDLFGNIGTCVQIINVVDTVGPMISLSLPGDLSVSVMGDCSAETGTDFTGTASASFMDDCSSVSGDVTYSDETVDAISDGCYTILRTWTATALDGCGNETTTSGVQTIEVIDQIAPMIELSAVEVSLACDQWACDMDQLVELGFASWTDNCVLDTAYITCEPVSGGCVGPVPTWDVEYVVIDACGNTSSAHQFVLLVDTVAPTIEITCPADVVVELDGECMGELDPTQSGEVEIISTDNCDAAPTLSYTVEDSEPMYTCEDGNGTYEITRTFHAVSMDHCGNVAMESCTQLLTVVDVTAPVITLLECPADTTVALGEDCTADVDISLLGMPSIAAEDGCDADPEITWFHMDGPATPGCDDSDGSADGTYSFERTFYAYATDACGNVGDTVSCVQLITAEDATPPVFGDFPPYEAVSCEDLTDPLDPSQSPLEVFDNCDDDLVISIEAWPLSGSCPGSWMRIWMATDDCGNTSMAEQYIALFDETAPMITCPPDTIVMLDQDIADDTTTTALGMAMATDNCSELIDIEITYTDGDFVVDCEGDDDQPEGTMSFIRTFTASDFCDNESSCDQHITLIDSLGPVVFVDDTTVSCLDYASDMTFGAFGATDNFDTDVAHSWEEDSVYAQLCAGSFSVDRTWTFVDDCGNTTTTQQTITVVDETAPILVSGEPTLEMSCEEYGDEMIEENIYIEVIDECGSDVTVTFFDTPFSGGCVQPVGLYMRTYTFEDDCGNANMFEQFIHLYDETPPTVEMTCPGDTLVTADADCGADLSTEALGLPAIVAEDNCGGTPPSVELTWTDHDTTTTCAGTFTFTRTFTATATDNCGNQTVVTCDQSIAQEDVTAPEFVDPLPEDVTVPCFDIPEVAEPLAVDGCDPAPEVTFAEEILGDDDCPGTQTIVRTWTATDACGNASSHSQTITLTDEFAPTWDGAVPGDTTVSCESVPEAAVLIATDNCDDNLEVVFAEASTPGDCAQGMTITRTWSVSDCAGNQLAHVQTLTVVDTTAPVIAGPLELDIPCTDWGMDTLYASVSDNCDDTVELELLSDEEFSGSCAGSYLRTYVATDQCGNSDTLIQSINLIDTEAPEFTFIPQDTTLSCDNDYSVGSLGAAEAVDNCDPEVEISFSDSITLIDDCPGTAEVVRTWTALDECGNNKTVEQLITLIDETDPTFNEELPADLTASCDDVPAAETLTATDNCDPDLLVSMTETLEDGDLCPNDYTLTRTWTVEDCAGNGISHTQVIMVVDTTAPTFVNGPADETVDCDAVPMPAELMELQAEDNCDAALSYSYLGETAEDGDCENSYTLFRTWQAADCSGNASTWTQTITVVDETAPELQLTFADGTAAGDTTVSCLADVPVIEAISTDACDGSPFMSMTADTTNQDVCGNATLTYTYMTADDCGNMSQATITITVLDEEAPEFLDVCGIADGATVDVCADDYTGDSLTPETDACDVTAADNCEGDVTIDLMATSIGEYAPNDSVTQYCTSVTPEAFSEEETCNGYEVHAMRLFNFAGGEFYSTVGEGLVSQLPNGDWLIEKTVVDNANPDAGWNVAFTLTDGMDYATWSDQDFPTSYKLDCEDLLDDHENWMYWFLSEGSMTGWGDYTGSYLTCTHQPANEFYRFQVGLGANNMNEHYGYSGWFTYSGTFDSTPVMGSGDFFGDLDCTLPYQLEYAYTATDCSGNQAEFSYTVNVTGTVCDEVGSGLVGTGGSGNAGDFTPALSSMENRGPIQVSNIAPNPTQDFAQFGFNVLQPMRIDVSLFDAAGMLVTPLYNGQVEKDQTYMLDINAAQLESGVYQVRISSNDFSIVKQFMVTE